MLVKNNSAENDSIPPLRNNNNTFSLSDLDKANTLNSFFSSISQLDDSNTQLPDFSFKTNTRQEDFNIFEQEIKDL
jgi:hypothetical protein